MISIKSGIKDDLGLISIEAADELKKFNEELKYDPRKIKKLSELIKEEFTLKWKFTSVFDDAYFVTYHKRILNNQTKPCPEEVSEKIDDYFKMDEKEIKKLVEFCVNLSDYAAIYEESIRELRKSK